MANKPPRKKRKSNGQTDSKDADIYGKQVAVLTIRLAVASFEGVRRLHELAEVGKEALVWLQTLRRTTKVLECSDRLAEALSDVGKEALAQSGRFLALLREAKPLLSKSPATEAQASCMRIQTIIERSSRRPLKQKAKP
ncbi:hypothetical protein HY524_01885 [Candidatus Berkelbacteria bacterium]|nr:hypothetical protein [Candidatus Berkelbacteria bacterium]